MAKFVFVTGGVVSSVGKGVCVGSIGKILKNLIYDSYNSYNLTQSKFVYLLFLAVNFQTFSDISS